MLRSRHRLWPGTCAAVVAGLTIVLAAAAGSSGQSAAGSPDQPAAATTYVTNPHWSPAGCRECHRTDTPTRTGFTPIKIEELCTRCHDGRQAAKQVHPSYRSISGDQLRRPGNWPLVNDRIGCITCHDVLAGCRRDARRPAFNSVFLRGWDGRNLSRFCNNCHLRGQPSERFNPHVMLDNTGKVMPSACTYCHLGVPKAEPGGATDPQAVKLRHGEAAFCMACHSRHVDYFEPGHLGRRLPAEMQARLSAAGPKRLSLAAGGRITCTTCHNPHQQGVFPRGSAEAGGAIRPGDSRRNLGLRLSQTELCRACHRK